MLTQLLDARTLFVTLALGGLAGCETEPDECAKDAQGRAHLTLEEGCKDGCPANVNEALAKVGQASCHDGGSTVTVTTGCGRIVVAGAFGFSGGGYAFDEASGRLRGVDSWSDIPWGRCNVFEYVYGSFSDTCATATKCNYCGPSGAPAGTPDVCPPF